MAKKYTVLPLTKEDQAGANQRRFEALDPGNPDDVLSIRVSQRDGDRVFDRLLEEGGPLEVEFDDVVLIVDRRPRHT